MFSRTEIRKKLKDSGKTMVFVARKLGMTRHGLDYHIKGEGDVDVIIWQKILDILAGNVNYEFSGISEPRESYPKGLSIEEQVNILKENKDLTAEINKLKKLLIKLNNDCGKKDGCLIKKIIIEIEDDGSTQKQ